MTDENRMPVGEFNPFQAREAASEALRKCGFAVMVESPAPRSNTGAVLTVSDPARPALPANFVSVEVSGSPEQPHRWTAPLYELESKLTRITSPEKAVEACNSCRSALVDVLHSRNVETLRDFYAKTYPDDPMAEFVNPLATVVDAAEAVQSRDAQIGLTGVADSKMHRDMLSALGARYGLSLGDMMTITKRHKSIMDAAILSDLVANGAYINKTADELIVSHLSDPAPEVIVFECSVERLCDLYEKQKAGDPLMVPLSDITDSLEVKGRYSSLHALAAAGHLQGELETQFESIESRGDLEAFVEKTRYQEERARAAEAMRNTEPDLSPGAKAVMDAVMGGCDLYNDQTDEFCCLYDDEGSIMVGKVECDAGYLAKLATSPQFDFHTDLIDAFASYKIVDSNEWEFHYGDGLPNPGDPAFDDRNEVFETIASQEGWGPASAERVLASAVERLTDGTTDVASLAEAFPTGVSEAGNIGKGRIDDLAVEH